MTIVITGCSSGFGLEAALAFARHGNTVVATMRDLRRGGDLRSRAEAEDLEIDLCELDVCQSSTFDTFVGNVIDRHGQVDVLINNAGVHRAGAFEDLGERSFRNVLETNCVGPLLLSKSVMPYMRRNNGGLIIMMSSLSGIAGLPGDVAYTASKFALEGATEALRHEVDRFGIRVALVEAGLFRTDIMNSNLPVAAPLPKNYPADSPYKALIEWQLGNLRERIPAASDPADVANLFVAIANSDGTRLRWPADPTARKVLATMLAQNDDDRDAFLRDVAQSDWWSRGDAPPGL